MNQKKILLVKNNKLVLMAPNPGPFNQFVVFFVPYFRRAVCFSRSVGHIFHRVLGDIVASFRMCV